jgi:hypothetical protein
LRQLPDDLCLELEHGSDVLVTIRVPDLLRTTNRLFFGSTVRRVGPYLGNSFANAANASLAFSIGNSCSSRELSTTIVCV